MLKYTGILGLPVLSLKEGNTLGHVYDIFFDLEQKNADTICIMNTVRKRHIKVTAIKLEKEEIVVQDGDLNKGLDKKELLNSKLLRGRDLLDKPILTNKGEDLGFVHDIYLDLDTWSVEAFKITDGIIQDLISGRRILPAIGKLTIKDEGIVISKDALEEMIESKKSRESIF